MKTYFKTNLDWYRQVAWPVLENTIPPIGSWVFVFPGSRSFCDANNIPPKLKVVDVYIYHDRIECDLWYDSKNLSLETDGRRNHLFKQ